MAWWGKVVLGALGYSLGGPLLGLLGVALGHGLDIKKQRKDDFIELAEQRAAQSSSGEEASKRERIQTVFFLTTFSIMGYIAKADGLVEMNEIVMADAVFDSMDLPEEKRAAARRLFNEGKHPDFPVWTVLEQFRTECRGRRALYRSFLTIQMRLALSDGKLHPAQLRVLRKIASRLLILPSEFEALLALNMKTFSRHFDPEKPRTSPLLTAYQILGVRHDQSDAEVKNAYRRMMSLHHPDKMIARGLPEELVSDATEKSKEIQAAWALIKKDRDKNR